MALTSFRSGVGGQVGDLHEGRAPASAGELPSACGQRRQVHARPQLPLLPVATQDQPGGAQLPEPLQEGLEQRPADPAAVPGRDHVQAEVPGLRQVRQQRRQRVAAVAEQLEVVDQDDDLRSRPPAAGAQLGRVSSPPGSRRRSSSARDRASPAAAWEVGA